MFDIALWDEITLLNEWEMYDAEGADAGILPGLH